MLNLNDALEEFNATEANLRKLEKIWSQIKELIPDGIEFVTESPEYDAKCRTFEEIRTHLPSIGGTRVENKLMSLNAIAGARLEAKELGEFAYEVNLEEGILAQGKEIDEYKFAYERARRRLIRDAANGQIEQIDILLVRVLPEIKDDDLRELAFEFDWKSLKSAVDQLETMFGSYLARVPRWGDLQRHLSFGQACDLSDIALKDWPMIKSGLIKTSYSEEEPVPVRAVDLLDLAGKRPRGPITIGLDWTRLTPEDFERLAYNLLGSSDGYENPEWLMKTNAPDKGRDISVYRVGNDSLSGAWRKRVIVQCRHRPESSVGVADISALLAQMQLWEPPRVDVLVIATTGRFSADAVKFVESHNQKEVSIQIDMWPESHLEHILAKRPDLVAEFKLRKLT